MTCRACGRGENDTWLFADRRDVGAPGGELGGVLERVGAVVSSYRPWAVFGDDGAQLVADLVERLLAVDDIKAIAGFLQRGGESFLLVHLLDQLATLDTGIATVHGIAGVRANRSYHAVVDIDVHRAVGMAVAAKCLFRCYCHGRDLKNLQFGWVAIEPAVGQYLKKQTVLIVFFAGGCVQ